MAFEYTRQMKDRIEKLATSSSVASGAGLLDAVRDLESLRIRSRYPARYQLMQFIEQQPHLSEDEATFSVNGPISEKVYSFTKQECIDAEAGMKTSELKDCVSWLVERAVSLDATGIRTENYYKHVFDALVRKNSWARYRESDQRYLNRVFDRHFAYEMGHRLGFTLEQMKGFLDRVLPDEVYINKDAQDLTEAFAFEHGLSFEETQRILSEYQANPRGTSDSYEVIDMGYTQQLYEEAGSFGGTTEEFVEWLLEHGPLLESRSRTAQFIYTNLLICAWMMMRALYDGTDIGNEDPVNELWRVCIEEGEDMQAFYARNNRRYQLPDYGELNWKKIASEFNEFSEWAPSEARERRYPRDFLLYLTIDRDGNFTTESTFSRIPRIMEDGKPVQKRDILCLLWLIYSLAWEYVAPEDISSQLHDFIDLATGVLEQCNFTFYLPHILEYSICRSLIIGGDMEDAYRSVINRGQNSPLCEELCVRCPDSPDAYGIRFYTCERYTYSQIAALLEALLLEESFYVYDDLWKDVEIWLARADQKLQCGWERFDDPARIAEVETLGRVILLPKR